jgi:hypothetical protein
MSRTNLMQYAARLRAPAHQIFHLKYNEDQHSDRAPSIVQSFSNQLIYVKIGRLKSKLSEDEEIASNINL